MSRIQWKGDNYRFHCCVCDKKWWSTASVSQCLKCRIIYEPCFDSMKWSKVARSKKDQPEQLGLGRMF